MLKAAFISSALPLPRSKTASSAVSHGPTWKIPVAMTGNKMPRRTFISLSTSLTVSSLLTPLVNALSVEDASAEALLARKSLDALRDIVQLSEYDTFRDKLRSGPMGRVRAACSALYRAMPEGSEERIAAEQKYKKLIKFVEAADLEALLASRKEGNRDVEGKLDNIVVAFDEFLVQLGL